MTECDILIVLDTYKYRGGELDGKLFIETCI